MSRKIKFRAWVNGHWTDFIPVAKTLGEYNESLIDTGSCTYEKDNPFIVEQYTGLKDKNRKEIYVGDIVSEHNGDIVGEIIQKPSGEYCIAWIGIYGGSSVLYDELSMCEVIGNIHEDKELLDGSN